MADEEAEEGGPELLSFRALAARLVADKIVERITHQRLSQLASSDPNFPKTVDVGRSKAVDYRAARRYFTTRETHPGQRTDLMRKRAEGSQGDGAAGE